MKRMTKVLEERPVCVHQWGYSDYTIEQCFKTGKFEFYPHEPTCTECGVRAGWDGKCAWCGTYPCNCCQICYEKPHCPDICECVEVTA